MKTVADLFANTPVVLGKTGQTDRHFVHVEKTPGDTPDGAATWIKSVEPGQLQNEYWVAREKNLLLLLKKLPQVARLRKDDDNSDTAFHTVRTRDAGIPLDAWLKLKPQHIASGRTLEHPFAHVGAFLRLARGILTALKAIHREGVVHANLDASNICLPYHPFPFDFETGLRPEYPQVCLIDFMFAVSSTLRLYRPLAVRPLAPPSTHSAQLRQALEADQAAQRADAIQSIDYSVDLYALGHILEDIFQRGLIYPGNMQSQMEMTIYNLIHELLGFDDGISDQVSERYGATLPHDVYIKRIDNMLALDPSHTSEDQDLLLLDPAQLLDDEPETALPSDEPASEPHQPAPDHKEPAGEPLLMTASQPAKEAPVAVATPSYIEVNKWLVVAGLVLAEVLGFIYHDGDKVHLDILLSILLTLAIAGGLFAALMLLVPRRHLFQYVHGTDTHGQDPRFAGLAPGAAPVLREEDYIHLSPVAVIAILGSLQLSALFYAHGDSMGLDVLPTILLTLVAGLGFAAAKIAYDRFVTPKPLKLVDDDEPETEAAAPVTAPVANTADDHLTEAAAVADAGTADVRAGDDDRTERAAAVAIAAVAVATLPEPVPTETPAELPEAAPAPDLAQAREPAPEPVPAVAVAEEEARAPVAILADSPAPVEALPLAARTLDDGRDEGAAALAVAEQDAAAAKHLELDNRIVIVVVLLLLLLFFWLSRPGQDDESGAPVAVAPAPEISEAPVVDLGLPEVPPAEAEVAPAVTPDDGALDSLLSSPAQAPAKPRVTAVRPAKPAAAKPEKAEASEAAAAEETVAETAPATAAPEAAPAEAPKVAETVAKPAEAPAEKPKAAKPLGNSLAEAQNIMGWHYFKGITVSKDHPEALNWFRKSAQMGNASGQFNLGMMYANGYGTAKNYQEAARWFKLAADQGKANAQLNLGLMYLAGRGVEQNTQEGMRLLQLAADQGDKNAQANLDALARGNKPLPETPAP